MNVAVRDRALTEPGAATLVGIVDCDVHPAVNSATDLYPFLERRWQEHIGTFGLSHRHGYQKGVAYPKGQPSAARRDAWPPEGGRPGSSLAFMQAQHLDLNGVVFGILNPLKPSGQGLQNLELAAALTRAVNDWQVAAWTSQDARLKASVVVAYDDPTAAVAEIERRAGDTNFAQVLLLSRTSEPLGQRRYWPIYEAAARANLPIGIHAFGYGGWPMTAGGWPSYYIEEMTGHAQCCQAQLTSLVIEGVFERIPDLRVVLIESGFAWLPSLVWRLDKHWSRLRAETPHLRRLPSEYVREHVWLTTQPMEEPEQPRQLLDVIGWIGEDRLLFATDYPHWDFDNPAQAIPASVPANLRHRVLVENALSVYGLN
jgi:predicted TIM-barrel fold metal-dependent hydrolase